MRSGDVRPVSPVNDCEHLRLADPKQRRNLCRGQSGRVHGSQFDNSAGRHFCGRLSLADDRPMSLLRHHVGRVVSARAKEEMADFNTRSVVAMVTNAHTGRDRTVGYDPRNAMGGPRAAALSFSCEERPVSHCPPVPVPHPFQAASHAISPGLREETSDGLLCENDVSHGGPPSKVPAVRLGWDVDASRRAAFIVPNLGNKSEERHG